MKLFCLLHCAAFWVENQEGIQHCIAFVLRSVHQAVLLAAVLLPLD
jgi:hypothetical protein